MTSVVVVADGHYLKTPNGDVYVESVFNYDFYKRYLSVFDHVYAIGRIEELGEVPAEKKRADGPGVTFLPIAPGKGLISYAVNYITNALAISRYLEQYGDCAIFRLPGVVPNLAEKIFRRSGKPYGIEVVVDPWEYFAPGANDGFVRGVVRRVWTKNLKRSCRSAKGVSYVTENYLQEKYPCRALQDEPGYFTSHYSSVEIPDDSISAPKSSFLCNRLTISHVANHFDGNAKGHITLLNVVRKVKEDGYDVEVVFVGDGPSRGDYEKLAKNLGIESLVTFAGKMPDGAAVRKVIAESDLFVFPTKAEGLPRVLLEAMAEGLPCLSSPVCGIPEILDDENMFSPNDVDGFVDRIEYLIENPNVLCEMSKKNVEVASRYVNSELQARRAKFYRQLKEGCRQ